ncbi:unnamed protein product, partial [marine sediment metagenome]
MIQVIDENLVQILQPIRMFFYILKTSDYIRAILTLIIETRNDGNFCPIQQIEKLAYQSGGA